MFCYSRLERGTGTAACDRGEPSVLAPTEGGVGGVRAGVEAFMHPKTTKTAS